MTVVAGGRLPPRTPTIRLTGGPELGDRMRYGPAGAANFVGVGRGRSDLGRAVARGVTAMANATPTVEVAVGSAGARSVCRATSPRAPQPASRLMLMTATKTRPRRAEVAHDVTTHPFRFKDILRVQGKTGANRPVF